MTGWARRPWSIALGLLAGALIAAMLVGTFGESVPARFEAASIELALPPDTQHTEGDRYAIPAPVTDRDRAGLPLVVDLALYEPSAHGFLPRPDGHGRKPRDLFVRRQDPARGPRIAVLLTEIGLDAAASKAALLTPGPVTLVVSPYAEFPADWARAARWFGHEALLEVPLQPARYPLEDAGPLALSPDKADVGAIHIILARAVGYLGVALEPGLFAANPQAFAPFAIELATRGLAVVALAPSGLGGVARDHGLPYLEAMGPIDAELAPAAIDEALARLASRAEAEGRAVGFGRPLPLTLARLALWQDTLSARGIALVGVGTLFDGDHSPSDLKR